MPLPLTPLYPTVANPKMAATTSFPPNRWMHCGVAVPRLDSLKLHQPVAAATDMAHRKTLAKSDQRGGRQRRPQWWRQLSLIVVRGLALPCFVVTNRPEMALRYVPPVLPPPFASRTVVRGLASPCLAVTNRPVIALRKLLPLPLPFAIDMLLIE